MLLSQIEGNFLQVERIHTYIYMYIIYIYFACIYSLIEKRQTSPFPSLHPLIPLPSSSSAEWTAMVSNLSAFGWLHFPSLPLLS